MYLDKLDGKISSEFFHTKPASGASSKTNYAAKSTSC